MTAGASKSICTTPLQPPAAATMESPPKPYWRFTKQDFYPEPTFQTMATNKLTLCQTLPCLKDRLVGRSIDSTELVNLKKQSENEMKKCLICLGFGSVVGSSIFSFTGQEARNDAGLAITISYVVEALIFVFCYTKFAIEIPVA